MLTDLDDLAASIRAVGLLTPVLVEDGGDGTYRLVAGARRHAAARMAGLTELPSLVRAFDPLGRKAAMLVENSQRVGLSQMEEAAAYQEMLSLDVDPAGVATSVGRSRAEVNGRLAVFALPRSVHNLMAEDALTYAEALLLTEVHPDDIAAALERRDQWGWTMGQAVDHVRRERKVTERGEAALAKLTKQNVPIIETPPYGHLDHRSTARALGGGYGCVDMTARAHRKEPCHGAFIGRDGSPVFVCTDWRRHSPEASAEGPTAAPDVKAERTAKRATNKARREAATERTRTATALLATVGNLDALGYLLAAVLDHAPREILPPAARTLGLDVPAGQQWEASTPAEAALRTCAAGGEDAALRAALAVHLALAEKDAGAEFPAWRGGHGVIAYADFLVANGYEETAGDAANRERYQERPSRRRRTGCPTRTRTAPSNFRRDGVPREGRPFRPAGECRRLCLTQRGGGAAPATPAGGTMGRMVEQATLWETSTPSDPRLSSRMPVGSVALSVDAETVERFLAKCAPVDDQGHRWWLGAIDGGVDGSGGYGRFQAQAREGGKLVVTTAHRYAWTVAFGPIPPALTVRHRCDEPLCTAVDHLELGTFADNSRDTVRRPLRAADLDLRGTAGRSRAIREAVLTTIALGAAAVPLAVGAAARAAMLLGDPDRDQLTLWP